jgi:hypothetical protein
MLQVKHTRRRFLGTAAAAIVAGPFGMTGSANAPLPIEGQMPSLGGATGWLNSQPLTAHDLRGKVVVVNFCTYTCINWLRSLPYVRAWGEKYGNRGFMVIGAHTPEFAFERDIDNLRRATKDRGIEYPIAVDSNYAIWRAFDNKYWPALYFSDAKGRIRHHRFGEGEYGQSESVIQRLLAEGGLGDNGPGLVSVNPSGVEAAADWSSLQSSDNYLGYDRARGFASPGGAVWNKRHLYDTPGRMTLNDWALSGDWTVKEQAIVLNEAGGRIACRFHSRDLHLVMGPAERETSVRFRVLLEGGRPEAARGSDIDLQGYGTVTEPRLYQLIRQVQPVATRQFEIEFLEPGVEAFAFTFG